MFLIDDNSPLMDEGGLEPRNWSEVPFGSIPGVSILGAEMAIIPMEAWPDLIADRQRRKATLKELWRQSRIGVWNQQETRYCHAFATAMGVAFWREQQGLPFKELSPSSIGGPVTNYQNKGWYIDGDLRQAVEVGVATTDFVPRKTWRRSDFRSGWEANAAENKVVEWAEGRPRNHIMQGTLLLNGIGYIAGLNWWGHAIWVLDLLDLNPRKRADDWTRYGTEFLNSYGREWGEDGFGVLTGERAKADSYTIVRQVKV